jgi:DNA-binding beta-propeller fold protein YncE
VECLESRIAPAFNLTISASATNAAVTHDTSGNFTANATGANINVADIRADLLAGKNVTISNGSTGSETGNITWQTGANLDYNGVGSGLSLTINADASTQAAGAVVVNSQILDSDLTTPNALSVSINAQHDLTVSAGISTGAGTILLRADAAGSGSGTLHLASGAVANSTNTAANAVTLRGADIDIATTPTAAAFVSGSGLNNPYGEAFDASGNLYVANPGNNTISKVTPAGTVTTFVNSAQGLSNPVGLAMDQSGNLYIANTNNNTVSKVTPAGVVSTFVSSTQGLAAPYGLAIDQSGNLYVGNVASGNNSVSKVTPAGVVSTFVNSTQGLNDPDGLVVDGSGNLYVANENSGAISKVTPAGVVSTFVASTSALAGLALDRNGNLYVANSFSNAISKVTPGGAVSAFVTTGLSNLYGLAFDGVGNLFVSNFGNNGISKVTLTAVAAPSLTVQSSVESRPMEIGGSNNSAVAGINLTNAELAFLVTSSSGAVTFGDSGQTGDITFKTATPATTAGASVIALQNPNASSKIVLDDDAAGSPGAALNGNGGNISLLAGYSGIIAASANNAIPEISTTGAVSLNSFGSIGSSANRIQFDAGAVPSSVVIGNAFQPQSWHSASVFLDGLGNLTLGSVTTNNAPVDVTARGNLVVAAGAAVVTGTGTLSLGADLKADETGDDGVGTLTIASGAAVNSANGGNSSVTLRGADMDVQPGSSVSASSPSVSTFIPATFGLSGPTFSAFDNQGNLYVADSGTNAVSKITPQGAVSVFASSGLNDPYGLAFDAAGNLYVANDGNSTVSKVTPQGVVSTFVSSGISEPTGLAFDASGNLYVANLSNSTLSKVTPQGAVSTFVVSGLNGPYGLAFDGSGTLYVANYYGNSISKVFPQGLVSSFVTGVRNPIGLAFDSGGNLFVASNYNYYDYVNNYYVYIPSIETVTPQGAIGSFATSGIATPYGLAFDPAGNLYVDNNAANSLSKFTPGGVLIAPNNPNFETFDSSGNLYVANFSNNTVIKATPQGAVSFFISSGLNGPLGVAFDSSGNLYVVNGNGTTVSQYSSSGALLNSSFITGLSQPVGVAIDSSGNIYVSNNGNNTIGKYSPTGAVINASYITGLAAPRSLVFDSLGNLYVANIGNSAVSEYSASGTLLNAVYARIGGAYGLAVDALGNLYVSNGGAVYKVASAGNATLVSNVFFSAAGLACDSQGNLYVADAGSSSIRKVVFNGTILVRSSVASRPMSLGGPDNAVAGINLTDAELGRIVVGSNGTIVFGDSSQTGDITFKTATLAIVGAAVVALQSTVGPGKIVLDDDAAGTPGAALKGNVASISLTAGTGGIVGASGTNTTAEIATTGAVSLDTTGGIGSSTNRIQFDSAATPSSVVIGAADVPGGGVFLDGLGNLTLGSVTTANAILDVTARGNLAVAANAAVTTGTGAIMLGADLKPDETGDDGVGTLTIAAGATVTSSDPAANSITLRGADMDIQAGSSVAALGVSAGVSTFVPFGQLLFPGGMTFDAQGNLYVSNDSNSTIKKVTPQGVVSTFVSSGLSSPAGLGFDVAGNLYVVNSGNNTISKVTPQGAVSTFVSSGLSSPQGLALDAAGNLYVANTGNNTVSKITPQGIVSTFASGGLATPIGVAVDSSGNLYVANNGNNTISEVTPQGVVSAFVSSGLNGPKALAIDAAGHLYVTNAGNNTVTEITPQGVAVVASGFANPGGLAVDAAGNLYVSNYGNSTVNKIVVVQRVAVRSSVLTRPMSLGGADNSVAGINLTDAELGRISVPVHSAIAFGDAAQTGDITFKTATAAATVGASVVVLQSTSGGGKIVLDDDAAGTAGAALNGNGGNVSLTAGTGGIVAASASNAFPEIANAGVVTLDTTGGIGSLTNRIQLNGGVVVIGDVNQPSGGIFLGGLSALTLGSISGNSTALDATAAAGLTTTGTINVSGAVNFILTAGSFTTHVGNLVSAGTSVTFAAASNQMLTTNGQSITNLIHAGAGTLTAADALTLGGNFTNQDGAGNVDITNRTVNVAGNWSWGISGSLLSNFSTVVFNGGNQSINGNAASFYNLTKTSATAATLTFQAGSTQTINGVLTLHGSVGNPLSLRSSAPGTQWDINPLGFRSVSFVDVQDSFDVNALPLTASNSVDSGDNTNWIVSPASTTTTVTSTTSATTVGQVVAFTATVTASGGQTPTGIVSFLDGGTLLGTGALSGGLATFSTAALSVGSHSITAVFNANANFNGSTSAALTQQVNPGPAAHFVAAASGSVVAGTAFNLTVTAEDSFNDVATGYTGTVHFTSSDGQATLPADGTLTNGIGTFSVTLKTSGSQTLTATDATAGSITGGSGAVAVSAAAASHFAVGAPAGITAGTAFYFTVTALDPYNNTAAGYTGTIHFTSNDPGASLPANAGLSNGVGTFVATFFNAGNRTLSATDAVTSSIAGSSPIAVVPTADPTFAVVAPANAVAAVPFTFTVTAHDQFNNTATLYNGTVHFTSSDPLALLPADTTLTNGTGTFTATLRTAGSQTITATDTLHLDEVGRSNPIATQGLVVSSFTRTPTGFTVTFDKPFNPAVINLYDAASANYGPADVVLAGQLAANNPVKGSLLIDPTNTTITFVKTGGVLTPDSYTVTLVSGANAFKDVNGVALDGNADGIPGDNYTTSFTVASSTAVVVSIPSFARGPDAGHNINVPNTTNGGIPLKLSNGGGVTDVTLTVNYDPTLLNVSGAAVNPALAGATLTLSGSSTPGHAVLVFHSPTALASGAATLGGLVAQVPDNAPYRNKALLDLTPISINGGAISATAQDAVQAVAYFGDASGNGTFSSLDASLISRVSSKLDSGFAAYRLLDPVIVADINNNGRIDANDASQFSQFLVNNASAPAIPPIPSPAPSLTFGGPDPTLSLPTGLTTTTDGVVVVPVLLDHPHPDGSTGMTEASLALTFDPTVFGVSAADVRLGTIPTSGSDWKLSASVDRTAGWIGIDLYSTTPIATSANGSLVEITFHVRPGASAPATAVQLVRSVQEGGQVVRTEVDDDQGAYRLSPAPTNAAPIVGAVVLSSARASSGAVASVGSEEATLASTEVVAVAPVITRGAENETVVMEKESSEATALDVAASMTSVEGNPPPSVPQLSATLASVPSVPSSSPMFQVLASPSLEQALPGGDLWDRLEAEPSSNSATPAEWSQTSALMEPSADRTEGVGSASALQVDVASRDTAFPAGSVSAGQQRTATSALDEVFADWCNRIEMPED